VNIRHEVFLDDSDYEEQEVTLDPERQALIEVQKQATDVVKYHIDRFFKEYSLHTGGKIPKIMLYNNRRISMVLNYSMINGIDHAHKILHENEAVKNSDESAATIIKILGLIAGSGVPQQFAGGMLCIYLELIEGLGF
jgi:hypothetical protein